MSILRIDGTVRCRTANTLMFMWTTSICAKMVVQELREMKLKEAAKKIEEGIEETLTYFDFSAEHWTLIRTNNFGQLTSFPQSLQTFFA